MGILKGQNFRVLIGGNVVAAATSCSLHISADLEETSTKDSTGGWKEQEAVSKSWDGSADALVKIDATESGLVAFDAPALIGTQVAIVFEEAGGAQNRVATSGGTQFTGQAIINDLSLTFQNKSNSTYSIQFTGVGELVKSTIASNNSEE